MRDGIVLRAGMRRGPCPDALVLIPGKNISRNNCPFGWRAQAPLWVTRRYPLRVLTFEGFVVDLLQAVRLGFGGCGTGPAPFEPRLPV